MCFLSILLCTSSGVHSSSVVIPSSREHPGFGDCAIDKLLLGLDVGDAVDVVVFRVLCDRVLLTLDLEANSRRLRLPAPHYTLANTFHPKLFAHRAAFFDLVRDILQFLGSSGGGQREIDLHCPHRENSDGEHSNLRKLVPLSPKVVTIEREVFHHFVSVCGAEPPWYTGVDDEHLENDEHGLQLGQSDVLLDVPTTPFSKHCNLISRAHTPLHTSPVQLKSEIVK
mmetsp:Transcript_100054/g.149954  ORF Transcript_100054/g.149954 Transcript_100054/m.149954 type:complete len:226 (-) Transcript_100054:378-1055(-)